MTLPVNIHKALVEKDLPTQHEKMLKHFALDFSICVRGKYCAREFSLHDWRQHKDFLSRRGEEGEGDYKEDTAFILYENSDVRTEHQRRKPLSDDPHNLMATFNSKWKQDSFNKDDNLVADLCMRGLIIEARGGGRIGPGTYALTEKGMRLSAPLPSRLAFYVAGEDLSFKTWVRVLVFFIITEFLIVPILKPVIDPIANPILKGLSDLFGALGS